MTGRQIAFSEHNFTPSAQQLIAGVALLLTAPLLTIIWFLVRAESPGPGFFSQVRVGRNQELIRILKFRTMTEGAHLKHSELLREHTQRGHLFVHIPDDHRATKFGKLLRKTGLDELPQLFNVFKGEMGFIGPRPMLPEEVKHLSSAYKDRFSVLPGITGLAQVNGRGSLPTEKYLDFDLFWVRHRSRYLNFRILLATPWASVSYREKVAPSKKFTAAEQEMDG